MIHQYRAGAIPQSDGASHIAEAADEATAIALDAFDRLDFSKALEVIWGLIARVDKFIVERAPWKLAKGDEDCQKQLDETLYTSAEALRIVTALLSPVIPDSAAKIWSQLGFTLPVTEVRTKDLHWGKLEGGQMLGAVSAVFPRADVKASIEKMRELEVEEYARQQALLGKTVAPAKPAAEAAAEDGRITIDDFLKVDLRVGLVKQAASVKNSDKLLHLQVDIGEEKPRSIVAGIALAYKPEALVGRKVVIVANLQPRKLRGLESQGMIVAASLGEGDPVLASFLEEVPIGARLR
jgi:methionyl-tRNA synthetase